MSGHLTSDADAGEDKMERRAAHRQNPAEIARIYTDVFFHEWDRLNCLPPTIVSPATEHIPEMIALMQCLVDKGVAYEISDGVYFDVAKFPTYGALSRLSLEGPGGRGARGGEPGEARAVRFRALEEGRAEHLQQWPSPWGPGFPAGTSNARP